MDNSRLLASPGAPIASRVDPTPFSTRYPGVDARRSSALGPGEGGTRWTGPANVWRQRASPRRSAGVPPAPSLLNAGETPALPGGVRMAAISPGKVKKAAASSTLHCTYLHDPGNRLDGASDLRAPLVAARQLHLDLLASAKHHDEVAFALPLPAVPRLVETFCHSVERSLVAHKDAQALLDLGGCAIERFDGLNAGPDLVALRLGSHLKQHRAARLQKVAVLLQPLGKDHGFILTGRIRQPDDAHLVACLSASFRARHHGRSDPPGGDTGFHGAGKS